MPEQLYFVMITISGGLRYVGVVGGGSLSGLKSEDRRLAELRNPKIYADGRDPTGQPVTMIMPLYNADAPQKTLYVYPEAFEVLGEIMQEPSADYCDGAQELYLLYKDAIAKWNARRAHIAAPTGNDIARINRKGKGGPVVLK
jgi:hypothetical protein